MWVRSIVKGSIPRPGDDIRLRGRALDRDRRVALERLPELALQYPAGGFPGLRLEPNSHPEAIPAVRYAASRCRSSPGQVTDRALPCTDLSCPFGACSQVASQSRAPAPGQDLKGP